jgi:outer membrane protein
MKKAVYLLFTTLLSLQVFAQQKNIQRFSLQEAVVYAKKNNIALKNGELDVRAAEKKVQETLAIGLPQINASANFINNTTIATNVINFGGQSTTLQFGQAYTATGSISASQLLFDGGFLMGVKGAREFVNMSKINLKRNNIETEVSVSTSYYLALSVQANMKLIEKNLETLKKTRDDLDATYKVGLVEKINLDRANLQYNNLNLNLLKSRDNYTISLLVLKLQMGMNLNDSIVLTDSLQGLYDNNKFELPLTAVDYNQRTEIEILNQNITLNTLNKKRYQFGYAPTISAMAQTQRNAFSPTFNDLGSTWYPGTYWGLNMSIPIFNGMRKSSQIQQAKIDIEKAENQKSQMIMNIDREVLAAKQVYQRASQQIEFQRDNLALAEEVYKNTQSRSSNGIGSSLELTTSINDLEIARLNFINTVYEFFVAQLEYKRAMGMIN